jgi:hypothetical protein
MESDDEDLKLAMAMSLQEVSPRATRDARAIAKNEPIDLISDSDDNEDEGDDKRWYSESSWES